MNVKLNYPWGMTWIDSTNLLITEKKSKEIILFNTQNNTSTKIKHEIPVAAFGQGGLLDILYKDQDLWISYSEDRGDWKTSTSIAKAKLNRKKLRGK